MQNIRKAYTADFKAKVVKEILKEEKTLSQIASGYETHTNVISRWRDQAVAALPDIFSEQLAQDLAAKEAAWEKEREELYTEIGKLSTQLSWLKKNLADCLSREERLALLDWTREELPVMTQAELLSLNRSSLYYQPVPPSAKEISLKHRIDAHLYTVALLWFTPYHCSIATRRSGSQSKSVRRHMHEMGILAIYPGPNLSKRARQVNIYPYLLKNVQASYPNHVWELDITYIRLKHGWMYLVAILDWYSRYIVS